MNLRELLLQFAGENEESFRIDELLSNKIDGIEIEKDITGSVKVLIENPFKLQEIKKSIQKVLDDAGYEDYSITPQSEGEVQHLIVETR
jgi:uncharacterized membrane protein